MNSVPSAASIHFWTIPVSNLGLVARTLPEMSICFRRWQRQAFPLTNMATPSEVHTLALRFFTFAPYMCVTRVKRLGGISDLPNRGWRIICFPDTYRASVIRAQPLISYTPQTHAAGHLSKPYVVYFTHRFSTTVSWALDSAL